MVKETLMMKSFIPAVAVALIAGSGFAAEATNSVTVRVADLNPSNPESARILEKRIETASLEACGAYKGSLSEVKRAIANSSCYKDTVAQAKSSTEVRAFAALVAR